VVVTIARELEKRTNVYRSSSHTLVGRDLSSASLANAASLSLFFRCSHAQSVEDADRHARKIFNALLYLIRSGCPRRFLLRVQNRFYAWRDSELWPQIVLRSHDSASESEGGQAAATAVDVDSQSVKTMKAGGPRLFDVAKKVTDRKCKSSSISFACPSNARSRSPTYRIATRGRSSCLRRGARAHS
jgi:transposase